jgi:hypothetical protein
MASEYRLILAIDFEVDTLSIVASFRSCGAKGREGKGEENLSCNKVLYFQHIHCAPRGCDIFYCFLKAKKETQKANFSLVIFREGKSG